MSNPILQLQSDVVAKLLSESALAEINIVLYRKLQTASEIDLRQVWLKPRGSRNGAGILVQMPTIEFKAPNVAGPERTMILPISIFEQPSINYLTSGTQTDAETITDLVTALLARFGIEGLGYIYPVEQKPNYDIAGVLRYDLAFQAEVPRTAIEQIAMPTQSDASLTVTLTNHASYPAAAIYYTTDGSFPGTSATRYTAPFTVASGATIRWAAYQDGYAGSDAAQAIIT